MGIVPFEMLGQFERFATCQRNYRTACNEMAELRGMLELERGNSNVGI